MHILRILQEESMKENTALLRVQVPVAVGTFLLNEKRADIHAVEARLKVSIVLIPNPHLETPNYSIDRVKQEALGTEEAMLPSYRLVSTPVQEDERAAAAAQEAKAQRPQAAVQAVTPGESAPIVREKTSTFLERVMSWFKSTPPEKPASRAPAPAPMRSQPASAPQARPDRGQRTSGPRADRSEMRPAVAANASDARQPERQRGNRPPRQKRPETLDSTPALAKQASEPVKELATQESAENRSKRSRRGGRRDRSERTGQDAKSIQGGVRPNGRAMPLAAQETATLEASGAETSQANAERFTLPAREPGEAAMRPSVPQAPAVTKLPEPQRETETRLDLESQGNPETRRAPETRRDLETAVPPAPHLVAVDRGQSNDADGATARESSRQQDSATQRFERDRTSRARRRPRYTGEPAAQPVELVLVETRPEKSAHSPGSMQNEAQQRRTKPTRIRYAAPPQSEPLIQVETK